MGAKCGLRPSGAPQGSGDFGAGGGGTINIASAVWGM